MRISDWSSDVCSSDLFFFAELSHDVKLTTLDGKARLAERAKPYLAQIPDGAFRDLMLARLREITGVDRAPPMPMAANATTPRRGTQATPRRSLVRSAIALLVQQPNQIGRAHV